jgi:hypothetical protein
MKEKQRELIVEIMKADEQLGLYPTRKQTAVDWLKDMLEWNYGDPKMLEISWVNLDDLFERAKQMEKDQIKEAHLNGQSEWDIKALEDINKKLSEEYYKETYE